MGTQAIISLVKKDHTFIKVICGCNGYNAEKLARIIKDNRLEKIRDIYKVALENHFGCKDCLVVMDENDVIFNGDVKLDPLYRETFDNPSFNPRWKNGIADNVIILKIDDSGDIQMKINGGEDKDNIDLKKEIIAKDLNNVIAIVTPTFIDYVNESSVTETATFNLEYVHKAIHILEELDIQFVEIQVRTDKPILFIPLGMNYGISVAPIREDIKQNA